MLKASKHEAPLKIRSPSGPSKTTTSIGCRCTGGNVLSRAVLIARTLSGAQSPYNTSAARYGACARLVRLGAYRTTAQAAPAFPFFIARVIYLPASTLFFTLHGACRPSVPLVWRQRLWCASDDTKVATAQGLHLFPFRTEKLNLATPMVLRKWESR